jgi:hypothetical protein
MFAKRRWLRLRWGVLSDVPMIMNPVSLIASGCLSATAQVATQSWLANLIKLILRALTLTRIDGATSLDVFPQPSKSFSSCRIPRIVTDSLHEADRSLQAGANIAACVMLGRALEALCRDILQPKSEELEVAPVKLKKKLMLGEGIKKLRDTKVIDDRLYDWSQQLQAFRNLAAHPEDISISREDAGDLQTFVNAIVEYVYDLADRYDEFKTRTENHAKRRKS